MSLRQALEKLRSDIGKETRENHLNDDNVELPEVDFDLSSEFFEEDEHWSTSTPLQSAVCTNVNITSDNAKSHRTPLVQVYNQISVGGDKSSDLLRCTLPETSSSQKLKSFAFSHSSRRDIADSDGLPPSKKPASEKKFAGLGSSQHTSFNTSIHCSVPSTPNSLDLLTNRVTNPVSCGSLVMKSSTPVSTANNKYNNEMPSLPVTPLSRRSAAKRKFPGPAGLLPKLLPNQSLDDVKLSVPVSPSFTPRSKVTTLVDLLPSSQGDCCDFSGAVWKSAVEDLSSLCSKGTQDGSCISELLKGRQLRRDQKGLLLEKVPFLVAVLKSVVPQGNGACVTLKDPTGEIPATLHTKVLDHYQTELIPGTIIILNKVSLFSPSQRRRYLNITINNVMKLYLQNGNIVTNEEAKGSNPVSVDNTPRSSPEDNLIAQDNLIDAVELFNTDISQEWCGFPDTVNTSVTTTVTSPPVCVSNSTISSTMNNINISSVASSSHTTHHNSFTDNSRGNFVQDLHVTTSSVSQFTDGLEDEDLDSLLRDFEEDYLCT